MNFVTSVEQIPLKLSPQVVIFFISESDYEVVGSLLRLARNIDGNSFDMVNTDVIEIHNLRLKYHQQIFQKFKGSGSVNDETVDSQVGLFTVSLRNL